jgi:hypothetical protein
MGRLSAGRQEYHINANAAELSERIEEARIETDPIIKAKLYVDILRESDLKGMMPESQSDTRDPDWEDKQIYQRAGFNPKDILQEAAEAIVEAIQEQMDIVEGITHETAIEGLKAENGQDFVPSPEQIEAAYHLLRVEALSQTLDLVDQLEYVAIVEGTIGVDNQREVLVVPGYLEAKTGYSFEHIEELTRSEINSAKRAMEVVKSHRTESNLIADAPTDSEVTDSGPSLTQYDQITAGHVIDPETIKAGVLNGDSVLKEPFEECVRGACVAQNQNPLEPRVVSIDTTQDMGISTQENTGMSLS